MESYSVLVIMLSVTLITFLVMAIVVLAMVIQIIRNLKETTKSAQHAAAQVEYFATNLKKAGKATAFGSVAAQFINVFKKGRKQ